MCRSSTYSRAVGFRLPMREPTYFVLAALLAGPLHGYAIIRRAEELSNGRVRLVSEEVVAGRVRRSYGLTDEGSAALRAEAQRMAEAARLVTGGAAARGGRLGRTARTA